jgi:hypothetical protein
LPVQVEQPCPDVTGRAQQPVAAVDLAACGAEPDMGGAMHQTGGVVEIVHIELMFD